jgi:cell division transport system permease protein
MLTAFSRIIKYGFQGFWRNGWLSTTTISILIITLVVFESLIIFRIITKAALAEIQDKIDISIYFKTDAPEDEILKIKKSLESLPEIKDVEYISRDLAIEIFKNKNKDNEIVTKSLEEIQTNPLSASLNIKARNSKDYALIASRLTNLESKELFKEITYNEKVTVIETLNKIIDIVERGVVAITLFFTAIAILVTFNTIRLAIYSNREEISIMRLVGASNYFIRGPYMIEGIIYGAISAICSLIITMPFIYFFSPYIKILIPSMNLWLHFLSNIIIFLGYQLFFGITLGAISSYIAVKKYLKI